ncbi:MAG: hypothetical protein ACE5H1_00785 [Thermodesulfobacteriota bacterium]
MEDECKDVSLIMQDIAKSVDDKIPDDFGFFVFVFPFNRTDGRANYVSNAQREDVIKFMKEFLIKSGHKDDWMRHLNI